MRRRWGGVALGAIGLAVSAWCCAPGFVGARSKGRAPLRQGELSGGETAAPQAPPHGRKAAWAAAAARGVSPQGRALELGVFVAGAAGASGVFRALRAGGGSAPLVVCRAAAKEPTASDAARWTSYAAVAALLLVAAPALAAGDASSSDWFQPFVDLNANLIDGIDGLLGSAGAAILVYTLLIKVVTFPLSQPALRTSAILQLISPQIQTIQRQNKNDETTQNLKLKRLYDEVGVNPLSALLPILVQLPIFVGLFRAIGQLARQDDHFKEPFLWIPSLSGPVASGNPTLDWLLKSQAADHFEPLVGWHDAGLYCVLPVIVILSQVLAGRMSSSDANQDQTATSFVFPTFVGISTLVSPSGLGLYWLFNNLLTAGQMALVQQQVGEELPEYKKVRDAYLKEQEEADTEGVRYTRESPFLKNSEVVEQSVAAIEERTSGNVTSGAPPTTRKSKRSKEKVKDPDAAARGGGKGRRGGRR